MDVLALPRGTRLNEREKIGWTEAREEIIHDKIFRALVPSLFSLSTLPLQLRTSALLQDVRLRAVHLAGTFDSFQISGDWRMTKDDKRHGRS